MAVFRETRREPLLDRTADLIKTRGLLSEVPSRSELKAVASAEASNASRYGLTSGEDVALYLCLIVELGATSPQTLSYARAILLKNGAADLKLAEVDQLVRGPRATK